MKISPNSGHLVPLAKEHASNQALTFVRQMVNRPFATRWQANQKQKSATEKQTKIATAMSMKDALAKMARAVLVDLLLSAFANRVHNPAKMGSGVHAKAKSPNKRKSATEKTMIVMAQSMKPSPKPAIPTIHLDAPPTHKAHSLAKEPAKQASQPVQQENGGRARAHRHHKQNPAMARIMTVMDRSMKPSATSTRPAQMA
jgi:hypothetical protein